jgi:hypothetical protein
MNSHSGSIMDGDSEEKVIAMHLNRPKAGLKEMLNLGQKHPSPGEIGEDVPPDGRDRAGDPPPSTDTPNEAVEPDYQPPAKKSDPLPKPGDAYRAHARFLNRLSVEQRLIHFVDRECYYQAFPYSDLRGVRLVPPVEEGGGPVLELQFVAAEITDVRIEGRNLEDIEYWIAEGTMPWVWEQPKGFKTRDDKAVVITRLTLQKPIEENGQQAGKAGGNAR